MDKKEQAKMYYYAKREMILAKARERYEKNKEVILERNRIWKEEHPNYMLNYREAHSDEISEYNKKKYKEIQETPLGRAKNLISSYKQKDKKNGFSEVIDFDKQWIVDNIFTSKCKYCGETDWRKLGCDRKDNTKGHTKDNVVPCCQRCNSKKGKMTYDEYIKRVHGK